jgi:hypothetical protein
MRVNVSQRIGSPPLKIYDENEVDVEMESINENTQMITILEIQGIRCSAKSFQIDVELKQIMVLKPMNLFEKCIIKTKEKDLVKKDSDTIKISTNLVVKDEDSVPNPVHEPVEDPVEDPVPNPVPEPVEDPVSDPVEDPVPDPVEELKTDDILEINLDIDEIENSETIHLKEKTEVYYQMYREARQKAKLAKSLALSSYLEARRIKNLYMLEDIDDSDESDLEDLEN